MTRRLFHIGFTGLYAGESSHGPTKSVYGADPDGNEFEPPDVTTRQVADA